MVAPAGRKRASNGESSSSKRARFSLTYVPYATDPNPLLANAKHGFKRGQVVRVRLVNFVTFNDVTFHPSPELNLIIGPNGAGKSTFVCGLCLGLAGPPSVLGRASLPKEFIRLGREECLITVDLYKGTPDAVVTSITRRIASNNRSFWFVDNEPTTEESVKNLVASMNIQVGNLTQFLPQDKVGTFPTLTSSEILLETQKAVFPPEMQDHHAKLVAISKELSTLEDEQKSGEKTLVRLRQRNEELERDVARFRERQDHIRTAQECKLKQDFIALKTHMESVQHLREERKQCRAAVNELMSVATPLENEVKKEKASNAAARKAVDEAATAFHRCELDASKTVKSCQQLEKKYDELEAKLRSVGFERDGLQEEIRNKESEKAEIEKDLEQLPSQEEIDESLQAVKTTRQQMQSELSELHSQKENVERQDRQLVREELKRKEKLSALGDETKRRAQLLRSNFRHVADLLQWVGNNKDRIKGRVHSPVINVAVANPLAAKYFENRIPNRVLKTIVCEREDDYHVLAGMVKANHWEVFVTYRDPHIPLDASALAHPYDISALEAYGIEGYLSSFIDAPPALKFYLMEAFKLNRIACGTDATDAEKVCRDFPAVNVYLPNESYSRVSSAYSRQTSTVVNALKPCRVYAAVAMDEVNRLKTELQDLEKKRNAIRESIKRFSVDETKIQRELQPVEKERMEMMEVRRTRKKLEGQVENAARHLETLKKKFDKLASAEDRTMAIKEKLCLITSDRTKEFAKLQGLVHAMLEQSNHRNEATLSAFISSRSLEAVELKFREVVENIRVAKTRLDDATIEKNEAESKLKELSKSFQQAAAEYQKEYNCSEEQTDERLEELPSNPEELRQLENNERTQADLMYQSNRNILDEYEKRGKEIEEKEKFISQCKESIEKREAKLKEVEQQWRPRLLEYTDVISKEFAKHCSNVGMVGEVELSENRKDYAQYALLIKIKFRDRDPLEVLAAHRQSGGEKACTTMLYLLSLSEINKCPFRVVDEINQGMDEVNERRIFNEMLSMSSAESETPSQCFLITPKLLPGLIPQDAELASRLNIQTIYNGPQVVSHDTIASDWFLDAYA